jgi:hypothetical protein|tara:strand:- start:275 stop:475 length:201 start_codon:yes stop_codon:yes gene_type:complete
MDKDKIQGLFLSGLCEDLTDYIDQEECQKIYNEMSRYIRGARCKCKHKGIRAKYLNVFNKELKNLD